MVVRLILSLSTGLSGRVANELKTRGVNDILIAVLDGLKGFPGAITSVFPQTIVQTCIVHLILCGRAEVPWKMPT
jgi:putative transposase